MSELYLVSCVSQKTSGPAPAKDLYTSRWFKAARRYVESLGHCWQVLSAMHGLVHPDDMLEPYNCTLNDKGVEHRKTWAAKVLFQLEPHLAGVGAITFLAGQRYREFLVGPLRERGITISIPLEHTPGVGKQTRWLKENCNA